MAKSLLERYRDGDREAVWRELTALGAAVRNPLYFPDAAAVAAETMKRARHNVESIITKLESLGYEFTTEEPDLPKQVMFGGGVMDMNDMMGQARQLMERYNKPGVEPRNAGEQAMSQMAQNMRQLMEMMAQRAPHVQDTKKRVAAQKKKNAAQGALKNPDVFSPPGPKAAKELDRFEKQIGGPLPLSLRHWFEQVGAVNLMGHHEAINPVDGPNAADPLVIFDYREAADSDYGEDLEDREDDGKIELALAPDALHKAHTSGGDPYSMLVPDPAADAPFEWDQKSTFVEYLRIAFAWGGFPGWAHAEPGGRPQKEIDFLKEGLLGL